MAELAQKIFSLDKDLLYWVLEMIDLIASDGIPKSRKVQYFNQNIHLLLSTYLEQFLQKKMITKCKKISQSKKPSRFQKSSNLF